MRGGAVWQLVGLITRRSQVQILPPLPNNKGSLEEGPFFVWELWCKELDLVQQNALAFWTHEVRPEGVRIDPREIRINPAPATK